MCTRWSAVWISGDDLAERGLALACELERLASGRFAHEPNRRLAGHLLGHAMHWFWFLIDPRIDATNYRGKQAIRPAVVNRMAWGGNRTWAGARWQSILTSVIRTCKQRGADADAFLARLKRDQPEHGAGPLARRRSREELHEVRGRSAASRSPVGAAPLPPTQHTN